MGVFSPGGSIPGTITGAVTVVGASNPAITVVSMPLAATEYSIALPLGCKQFLVKLRNSKAKLQIAYILGNSGTTYLEVPRLCFYAESNLGISAVTLYFQSPTASQELEVLTWV